MPKLELSDEIIANIPTPARGATFVWDSHEKAPRGFGVFVTAMGVRSFLLAYRVRSGDLHGKERRIVIGRFGRNELTVAEARRHARRLRDRIVDGYDPLGERHAVRKAELERRTALTVSALCDRYLNEWAPLHKRARSVAEDASLIRQHIKRVLGDLKVFAVSQESVKALHREITNEFGTPVRANLALILLSKMMNLAIEWGLRSDNPVKGVSRNRSEPRRRYLDVRTELPRLTAALERFSDREGIDAIRLLLLTGARKSEVLNATWPQFDLRGLTWTKPASSTKQRRTHVVELSPQSLQILKRMRRNAESGLQRAEAFEARAMIIADRSNRYALLEAAKLARAQHESPFLFPSIRKSGQPLESVRKAWRAICMEAKLGDFRLHDLRH